jgi:hypothetical protein
VRTLIAGAVPSDRHRHHHDHHRERGVPEAGRNPAEHHCGLTRNDETDEQGVFDEDHRCDQA